MTITSKKEQLEEIVKVAVLKALDDTMFKIVCGSVSLVLLVTVALMLGGCWQHNISGKYIAKSTNEISLLQLVETPDGHITGQLETQILKEDGKIEYHNLSVTGAADGENVSLSFKSSPIPFTITAFGTLNGNRFILTGGFSGIRQVVMVRSNLADYQEQVSSLNTQSQNILVAK